VPRGGILAEWRRSSDACELEELGRALDAARAGSGATVLVAGEAGIGKTRLASELAGRACAAIGDQVLAAGQLGRLPEVDGGAGVHEVVDDDADGRAGAEAGRGVGLAALDRDHQLAELDRLPP
jgi:hypothetical protein